MPEQPGAAAAPNDDSAAAGAAGGSADAGAGAQDAQAAERARQDLRLTKEAAKYRIQARESQKQLDATKAELEALRAEKESGAHAGDASEVSTLKRQMADLQKSLREQQERATNAEQASKQEKLDNALLKAVSDAKLVDSDEALVLVANRGRARIADDGKPVFIVSENGEEREVPITADSIKQHKLVSEKFFPAEGAAGSGSRGGSRGAPAPGVDMNRALTDLAYFDANKDKILAAAKSRQ